MLVSLLFHRNWYQLLAWNVVVLALLFANTFPVSRVAGEHVVSLLTYTCQLWCPSLLLKTFPRLCACAALGKITNQLSGVGPLSKRRRPGLFSREGE